MRGEVIMVQRNRGNRERNVQVYEGEEAQVDLNSRVGRQRMRGWGREGVREEGLVKVKRDFVRSVFFIPS